MRITTLFFDHEIGMEKLCVDSAAELVRLAKKPGVKPLDRKVR
jgi:hypothetical protein